MNRNLEQLFRLREQIMNGDEVDVEREQQLQAISLLQDGQEFVDQTLARGQEEIDRLERGGI